MKEKPPVLLVKKITAKNIIRKIKEDILGLDTTELRNGERNPYPQPSQKIMWYNMGGKHRQTFLNCAIDLPSPRRTHKMILS